MKQSKLSTFLISSNQLCIRGLDISSEDYHHDFTCVFESTFWEQRRYSDRKLVQLTLNLEKQCFHTWRSSSLSTVKTTLYLWTSNDGQHIRPSISHLLIRAFSLAYASFRSIVFFRGKATNMTDFIFTWWSPNPWLYSFCMCIFWLHLFIIKCQISALSFFSE